MAANISISSFKKLIKFKPKTKSKAVSDSSIESMPMSQKNEFVPAIIVAIVTSIELSTQSIKGIYRIPGNYRDLQSLKEKKICNDDDWEMLKEYKPTTLGSYLKTVLKDMREPLISFTVNDSTTSYQLKKELGELCSLSRPKYNTLYHRDRR